jgi:tRNA threonylcarbamoyladenosine biosynthesis protein TsaE
MSAASWNAGAVDEAGLRDIATRLAAAAGEGGVLYLEGDLGAGKTTFARALLASLGVGERVKSPTYSLIESYRAGTLDAHHLDLYRIADAGELEWLGLSDLWTPNALVLIEWPERGAGALPPADLVMRFRHAGDRREVIAEPRSSVGERLVAALSVVPAKAGT